MKKILVPIDGSKSSIHALQEAINYSANGAAEVHALNVQAPLLSGHANIVLRPEELNAYYENEGKAVLIQAQAAVKKTGATTVSKVKIGPIAQSIVEYAHDKHFDLIIMGTRGLGAVPGLLLGSVTNKVVHLATIPVMLVK